VPGALVGLLGDSGPAAAQRGLYETAERRVPDLPTWGALVRVARHALGVRAAAARLAERD